MSMNVSNYSQFYRGTEKVNQYGSVSTGGKDTLVRYEFNTMDENGNKIMDKMSREETLQTMKEISSQYGDNVIVEFSGDGLAKLVESRKGQLDNILGGNRAEKQAQFNNDVVQRQGAYRKVEGKIEDGEDFHTILKANNPELAKQVEEMNMRIINHKPGTESNAKEFYSLIKKAVNVVNTACEKEVEATKSNDTTVSFYGASVTQEQSEKLQEVIKGLEQQEQDNLGENWNVGAYAQLGLKVSQLSYACKEMGLADEAANQIVGAYGKQAEEKINKMNDWVSYAYEQAKAAREELYKKYGTPNYRPNAKEMQEKLVHRSQSGKTSVELNAEANSDIYQMFSNLDVSSKNAFKSSFDNAMENYKNYLAGGEVPIYTGTSDQQSQIAGLVRTFQNFIR